MEHHAASGISRERTSKDVKLCELGVYEYLGGVVEGNNYNILKEKILSINKKFERLYFLD